jgi:acetyltransferase-like isoleucine patch superfamily enzyme
MSVLSRELTEWYRAILASIPGEIGCWLRRKLYGFQAGRGTRVLSGVTIYYPRSLTLGDRVGIAAGCQINAAGSISIGNDVLIGPRCVVWSQNHCFASRAMPIQDQGYETAAVQIDRDVWIGAGAVILPGVHLAEGAVVGAGAVVTHSCEPFSILGGIPARKIGVRGAPVRSSAPCDPVAHGHSSPSWEAIES